MAEPGLRERKKQRVRAAISEAAITLFQESGFDGVTVADIAAAAEVSKPTLFAYFPSKEDLVLHRFIDHEDEPARVVRGRASGVPPLTALRRNFLDGLDRHDPVTGLNDTPQVLVFHNLLYSTPALITRLTAYMLRAESALAEALAETVPGDDIAPMVAAAQIFGTQRVLGDRNVRDMRAGRSADDVRPEAVARAEAAFDLLERGLAARFG
ncbi:TetR family transcriptional regulator [Actinomadura sp. CNU-125]|uniref:TetR/AcrR family transcriptional regulator n=1 Tax=Actinomadura sp. CNU-125 TaxID=1904961 RepID=UPI000969FFAA|nr:TetR family transcriptional regulator [Actinomadura sp. CNU-125]OLT38226.1 TetR family transcriptional regulator [Actinomadura sp. CNU-125]